MPTASGLAVREKYRKWRPSGRNQGRRWPSSPWDSSCGRTGSHTARLGHAEQAAIGSAEDYYSVAAPRAAYHDAGRLANNLRRAAGGFDPLHLPLDPESDKAAVRRPERKIGRALGTGQGMRRDRIERADPQHPAAVRAAGDESQL